MHLTGLPGTSVQAAEGAAPAAGAAASAEVEKLREENAALTKALSKANYRIQILVRNLEAAGQGQ